MLDHAVFSNFIVTMKLSALAVLACLAVGAHAAQADDSVPSCEKRLAGQTLIWRIEDLQDARRALASGDPRFEPALANLVSAANDALQRGPYSVVNKTQVPHSGDTRDYMSLAPYWWPEEGNNRRYVRRDGQVNPERDSDRFDKVSMRMLRQDVPMLALAAFFTGDDRYATHAERLLRTWFVDPATRMNPNLRFAQAIPGRNTGRPTGIIDTQGLTDVVDAIELLHFGGRLDSRVVAASRQWFAEYTEWLTTEPMALEEKRARNNHGTYYDVQVMAFALFSRQCDMAAGVIEDAKRRIEKQIAQDGFMPEEIGRTRSFHYHIFNTDAFLKIARLAEHFAEDLYTFKPEKGASILSSVRLLSSYAGRESSWPYERMGVSANVRLWRMLRSAATADQHPWLLQAINEASGRDDKDPHILLTASIEIETEIEKDGSLNSRSKPALP